MGYGLEQTSFAFSFSLKYIESVLHLHRYMLKNLRIFVVTQVGHYVDILLGVDIVC